MTTEREMSLQEYVGTLPDIHRAVREYRELVEALEEFLAYEPPDHPPRDAYEKARKALALARGKERSGV